MRMITGSHQWGLVEGSNTFGQQDLEKLARHFIEQTHRDWQDEPVSLKAGQVSFHHALIFHGSGPNRTSQTRMGQVVHMMPGDTAYRAGKQWHPNLVFLGPNAYDGQPFSGDFFPQIWPAAEA
jgi:ectoine hydroxylase-related dioxygenase (phytanoyl-CoA dioxygenase family)